MAEYKGIKGFQVQTVQKIQLTGAKTGDFSITLGQDNLRV